VLSIQWHESIQTYLFYLSWHLENNKDRTTLVSIENHINEKRQFYFPQSRFSRDRFTRRILVIFSDICTNFLQTPNKNIIPKQTHEANAAVSCLSSSYIYRTFIWKSYNYAYKHTHTYIRITQYTYAHVRVIHEL